MKNYTRSLIFGIALLVSAVIPSIASATPLTLWQYFGSTIPSFAQRAFIYNQMTPNVQYTGSVQQNDALLGYFLEQGVTSPTADPILGAVLPDATALFQTSLASGIQSTDTSMILVSNSIRGGGTLSGYQCFTVDQGYSTAEYMCGIVSGMSVTNIQRGIDLLTGTTTNISLEFQHRRAASVIISDYPILQILKNQANGAETFPNILNYTYSPNYANASTSAIASKGYVDGIAIAGAPNATESSKGIVELATQAEMASSSSTGSSGASIVLQSKYATSSPGTNCGLCVPIAQNDGKLSPIWLNGAGENYTLNGTTTLNSAIISTSTINTLNVNVLNAGTISSINSLSQSFTAGQSIATGQALSVLPYPANQVTFDNGAVGGSSSTASDSNTFVVGNNPNRTLIVDVQVISTPTVSSITYNGTALTQVAVQGSGPRLYVYELVAPPIGAHTLTITYSTSSSHAYAVYSYYNTEQTQNVEEVSVGSGNNPFTFSLTPFTNGSIVFGAVGGNFTSCSIGGAITSNINTLTNAGFGICAGDTGVVLPPSSQVMSVNGDSSVSFIALVSIKPVGANPSYRTYLSTASQATSSQAFIGFSNQSVATGSPVTTTIAGIASGFSNLYFGNFYLSNTPGAISTTTGTNARKVCIAINQTQCNITNEW